MAMEIDRKVTISDLIQIGLIIAAIFAGWVRFDSRINDNAEAITRMTPLLQKLADGQDRQNAILGRIVQNMEDYPLHRHVNGEVVYPPNHTPYMEPDGKAPAERRP